jgi:hypothetical protein
MTVRFGSVTKTVIFDFPFTGSSVIFRKTMTDGDSLRNVPFTAENRLFIHTPPSFLAGTPTAF